MTASTKTTSTFRIVLRSRTDFTESVQDVIEFYSEEIEAESYDSPDVRSLINRLERLQTPGGIWVNRLERKNDYGDWVMV